MSDINSILEESGKKENKTSTGLSTKTSSINSIIQESDGGPTISINPQKKKTKEEDGLIDNMESFDPPEVNNAYSFAFGLGLKDTARGVGQITGLAIDNK